MTLDLWSQCISSNTISLFRTCVITSLAKATRRFGTRRSIGRVAETNLIGSAISIPSRDRRGKLPQRSDGRIIDNFRDRQIGGLGNIPVEDSPSWAWGHPLVLELHLPIEEGRHVGHGQNLCDGRLPVTPFADGSRTGSQLQSIIEQLADSLDMDGDGEFRFATDGVLLLAYSLGIQGDDLEPFASTNATRNGDAIGSRLDDLLVDVDTPPQNRQQSSDDESVGYVEPNTPSPSSSSHENGQSNNPDRRDWQTSSQTEDSNISEEKTADQASAGSESTQTEPDDAESPDEFFSAYEELGTAM